MESQLQNISLIYGLAVQIYIAHPTQNNSQLFVTLVTFDPRMLYNKIIILFIL